MHGSNLSVITSSLSMSNGLLAVQLNVDLIKLSVHSISQ
jgi:hypothetical protein